MTSKDIFYSSFVYLLHRVTPNLRFIFLEIKANKIILKCYYEFQPSDLEKELIQDIGNDILTITDKVYKTYMNIM